MSDSTEPGLRADATASLELTRADLGFSAAHFGVVGGRSERLHGHNYRVSIRAHGIVGADGTVVDFHVLKEALRAECALLDEFTLIPTMAPSLHVDVDGDDVIVREGSRRFVLPRTDVRLLAVPNTTCECLAGYVLSTVRARLGEIPVRLQVTVEELPGQGATIVE